MKAKTHIACLALASSWGISGCAVSVVPFGEGFDSEWVDANIDVVWQASLGSANWGFGMNIVQDAACIVTPEGSAYMLDVNDGSQLASSQLTDGELLQAASCDGKRAAVIYAQGDIALHSLADGSQLWRREARRGVVGLTMQAGDSLIMFGSDGIIEAWSANSGVPLWEHRDTAAGFRLTGHFRPAVANGTVYAGLPTGDLIGLTTTAGALRLQASLHDLIDPDPTRSLTHIAEPAFVQDKLCAAAFRGWTACFDLASGSAVWQREISVPGALAAADEQVFVVDDAGTLHALDANSGVTLWERPQASAARTPMLAVTSRLLAVADGFEGISAYVRTDGTRVGGIRLDGDPVALDAIDDDSLLVYTDEGEVYHLHLSE